MKSELKIKIDRLMKEYDIPYCIHAIANGIVTHIGTNENLEYPNFPETIINDQKSISSLTEYLNNNIQPRMLSQGNVRSIMGMMPNREVFAYFLNSKSNASEHYKIAKTIYEKTTSSEE